MKSIENATTEEILADILGYDGTARIAVTKSGKVLFYGLDPDNFIGTVWGSGDTVREAAVDFMVEYLVGAHSVPGRFGLFSGILDWSGEVRKRVMEDR